MKDKKTFRKNRIGAVLASLCILLFAAAVLRADVTFTDRQALEKEARKKQNHYEKIKAREQKTASGIEGKQATGSQWLIDESGLKWFFDTNITFSTSSSASGAASEASYTNAVVATTSAGGTTFSTLSDMFDGYNAIAISVTGATGPAATGNANYIFYNKNGTVSTECSGRQVVFNPQVIDNIRVQRKVYVPLDDAFCRWLNIFTNQDTVSRTFNMIVATNLGSDSNTRIVTTSDGDAVAEVGDDWVTTMQNYSGNTSSDPRIGHVLKGPGAPVGLASVNFVNGDDNPFWAYTLTLAPGQTAIIMNFAVGQPSKAAAAAKCGQLISLPDHALACMSPAEMSQVRNFKASAQSYTVRFLAGTNGTVTGRLKQVVLEGDNTSPVTAVANPGYIFVDWTGNNGFVSTANPLTLRNVRRDMTVTANFANLPPTVAILTPANGATVSGTVAVSVEASDLNGIARVELAVDGRPIGANAPRAARIASKTGRMQSLFPFTWDTTGLANGQHSLTATAFDNLGLSSSVTHKVNIENAVLTLQASRLNERTWTMINEYGHLVAGLIQGSPATSKYAILRKEGTGQYVTVKEIALGELAGGNFTWDDGYLKKGIHYTYKIVALNSAGAVVGASAEISI